MKKSVRLISAVMCLVMLFSAALPMNAFAVSEANSWTKYLEEGKGLYIGPGADDTEMYVTWYGGKDGVTPTVKVSANKDMTDAKVFEGTVHSSDKVERSNHVTVTGLEKGKTYYYVCSDGTTDTEVYSFKTVAEGADFSAMYVSDIHLTGENFDDPELYETAKTWDKVLVETSEREDISLILSGGDMATEGRPCEYYAMFLPKQVKTIPYAMAIGNHDVKRYTYDTIANYPNAKLSGRLSKSLIHGDYYFVKGNALFVVLDSTNSSAADHYFFVKNAVKENPDVKWRVMMFHHDLYGGHIESRESENMLLRLLFTPIIDAFQFDLVLTGHSHCFSRSHVVYRNKVAEDLAGKTSVTDPKGTIYLNNGSLSVDPNSDRVPVVDSDRKSEFIATDYLTGTEEVYNILDFTDDSLTIKSYTYGSESAFTEFTINKTSQEGGHPDKGVQLWFVIGKYIGTIYNMINNISRMLEIKERG